MIKIKLQHRVSNWYVIGSSDRKRNKPEKLKKKLAIKYELFVLAHDKRTL